MIDKYVTDRKPIREAKRVVCWFSCGAESAVATKMAIAKWGDKLPIVIAYCDTKSEHPDNERFLKDCEKWFGQEIVRLTSGKYEDIWDVFEKERYIAGTKGAKCTQQLKTAVCQRFEDVLHDIQVFGFDAEEVARANERQAKNAERCIVAPLIDNHLSKSDCLAIIERVGIELPEMYKLGYSHNNCIGCVKGQQGYWNKVRIDFPETFIRMAKLEREIGAAINKSYAGDGKRKRVFLDELDPEAGLDQPDIPIVCGLFCEDVMDEYSIAEYGS